MVALGGDAALGTDRQPLPDRVETLVELRPGPVVEPEALLPIGPHEVGRTEAPGVVDQGAATEARAGEQADALIVGRNPAAVQVEARVAGQLVAVEVLLAEVAPRLQHDHVEARRGEHAGRGAAAGAGADHADVAVELGVLADLDRLDPLRGRVRGRSERSRIPERLVYGVRSAARRWEAVVAQQDALAQGLEGGPALDVGGVREGEQRALALGLRQRRERRLLG